MTPTPTHQLALRYFDGQAVEAETAELDRLLIEDRQFADWFVRLSQLEAALSDHFSEKDRRDQALQHVLPAILAPSVPACPEGAPAVPARRRGIRRLNRLHAALSILAVAVLVYGGFTGVSWNIGNPGNHPGRHRELQEARTEPPAQEHPAIARHKSADGHRQITLQKGVALRIEGPTQWTLDGANRITLTQGKLVATVPPRAIGFTVETPTATIVDLGTEFGVEVDPRGHTQAHVFRGEIQLQATPAMQPDAAEALPYRRLTAGQGVRISTTGQISPLSDAAVTAEQFLARPAQEARPARPRPSGAMPAYCRAVLGMPGRLAYWRLEEDGRQFAADEVEATVARPLGRAFGTYYRHFMADFNQPGALADATNRAVHFNGESFLEIEDHPSLNGDWDGVTLTAWIKPDRQQPASAGPTSLIVGKWAYEVTGDAYALFYEHSGRLQFAVGNGANGENGLVGAGNVPIDADAYHFVVGTWEKATGNYRLYVDGQPDSAQGQQKAPHQVNAKGYVPVLIGGQRANNSRYFAGCIDEVSIFNRALTADEVEQLYRLATGEEEDL